MLLPADVARCRGITKRGALVLVCSVCQRRHAWADDHRREVERTLVVEPPKRVIDCSLFMPMEEAGDAR